MNILWDLRLFSYGYGDRGIGAYCSIVAASILELQPEASIFAWGDREAVPAVLKNAPITWIEYRAEGWKNSVWILPFLVFKYRIDICHHWVTLGPLRQIGIAPWTGAKTVATVHDLGVETWNTPYGRQVKAEMYWQFQKRFFGSIDGLLANSNATLDEIRRSFPALGTPRDRVLPPVAGTPNPASPRSPLFITLGGSVHKNCARVVAAFEAVRLKRPEYRLVVLGDVDRKEEGLETLPNGVAHEPVMGGYEAYLRSASGLLFCSLHEGLGLPPLEAMLHGCPLVLSDIPALRETCTDAARFVDPFSVESIAAGIEALIADNEAWAMRSRRGAEAYRLLSADAPHRCLRMYEKLTGATIRRRDESASLNYGATQ